MGFGHEQTCPTDMSSGPGNCGRSQNAERNSRGSESSLPQVRVFDGRGRGTQNKAEGGVFSGMVWGWAWPSYGSKHPHPPLSQGLPGEGGKVWGIMARTGVPRGTHYLYNGNLYERTEKKKQKMLPYLREACQGPMDTGLHVLVDWQRGQLWLGDEWHWTVSPNHVGGNPIGLLLEFPLRF